MKKSYQTACIAQAVLCLFAGSVYAADTAQELTTVQVKGMRVAKLPNVDTVSAQQLQRTGAQNLDDTVLYQAGVDVQSDNMQTGHTGYVIRGITENRIQMTVDGIPLPDAHKDLSPGASTSVGRDVVETDTLRQVQIDKSGNSAEKGAGSLGGSVNMATYSPFDFVNDARPLYFGIKYGYRSTYRSHGITATAAAQSGPFAGLLMLTRRTGREIDNVGDNAAQNTARTVSNEQRNRQYNILAKAALGSDVHRIEGVFEQFGRNSRTERADRLGITRGFRGVQNTTAYEADDKYQRRRIGLSYRYTPQQGWLESTGVELYRQAFEVWNNTADVVAANGSNTLTTNNNDFKQTFSGIRADMQANPHTGPIEHRLQTSGEYRLTESSRLLDRLIVSNGSTASARRLEQRFFPPYKRRLISIFAQDKLIFPNKISLALGLRYERERLKFEQDETFAATSRNILKADSHSSSALSPSLRLSIPLNDSLTGFVSYARGYRLPPVDSVAAGYDSSRGYRVVPNLDLKPERSHNFETGLNYGGSSVRAKFAAFYNRYQDFIETAARNNPAPGYFQEFYFANIDQVNTYGAEFSGDWQFAPHWKASVSMAWMRGKNKETGTGLDSAHPFYGNLGLAYEQEKWSIGTHWRWSAKKNSVSNPAYFKAPGYGVFDLNAYYRPVKQLELNVGVYNIGNKRYWRYADVIGVSDNALVDRNTQPGRNVSVGLNWTF